MEQHEILDLKSRQVLTNLLDEQIDQNENLGNENVLLKEHLRKLLQLLQCKDGQIQEVKTKLLSSNYKSNCLLHLLSTRSKFLLESSLHRFARNASLTKSRYARLHSTLTKILITKPLQAVLKQLLRKHHSRLESLPLLLQLNASFQLKSLVHAFKSQSSQAYASRLRALAKLLPTRRKQQAKLALVRWAKFSQGRDKILRSFATMLEKRQQIQRVTSFLRISEYIRYKEKAFYQIHYFKLKNFSKNLIFADKLNHVFSMLQWRGKHASFQALRDPKKVAARKRLGRVLQRIQKSRVMVHLKKCIIKLEPFELLSKLAARQLQAAFLSLRLHQRTLNLSNLVDLTRGQKKKRLLRGIRKAPKGGSKPSHLKSSLYAQKEENRKLQSSFKAMVCRTAEIMKRIEHEKAERNAELKRVRQEAEASTRQERYAKEENQRLQKEIQELRFEVSKLNELERKQVHGQDQLYREKLEAIQKLEEASYTIKYMKKDQAEFKDQMNRVEEYNKQLFEEMDQKNREISQLNSKLEEYEVQVELLQVQLNHQVSQSRYSSRTSTTQSHSDQSYNRLKQQNSELTKEAIQLNEEKLQLKEIIQEFQEDNDKLKNQKHLLEDRIQQLLKLVEDSQVLKQKENQNQHLIQRLEKENAQRDRKDRELESQLEATRKELYIQSKEKDHAIEKLRQQLAIVSSEKEALEGSVADLNREKVNLMRELTLKHEGYQKGQVERDRNNIRDEITKYEKEIEGYQGQLELYVKVLKQMDEKIKRLEGK